MSITTIDTNNLRQISSKKRFLPVLVGKLLPILMLTLITILYSRKLSYTSYGEFQIFWLYSNILGIIISFGLISIIFSNSLTVLYSYLKKYKHKIIKFYILLWLIIFSVFFIFTKNFQQCTKLLLLLFIAIQFIGNIADTLFIKNSQLNTYLVVNIFYSIAFFLIHLYFLYQPFILDHLIIAIIFLSILKAATFFLVKFKAIENYDEIPKTGFFKNWFFISVNDVISVIARWLDKIFLVFLLSPSEFAIFFNGSFELPLFGVLISTMESIMLIGIVEKQFDKQKTILIFKDSFKVLALISFPIFFFFLISYNEVFAVIFSNKYNASTSIFLICIFLIPLRINHYGVILQSFRKSNIIALGSFMDIIIALLLMLILYPHFGTAGVALSIVISTYLQVFYYLFQSAKILQVKVLNLIPIKFLFQLFVLVCIFYTGIYFLKFYFSSLLFIISGVGLTILIIVLGVYYYLQPPKQNIVTN